MDQAELFKLQARLPAGIKITFVRGMIHYTVRTSRHGRKYSLGTFSELDEAIDALVQFKTKLMDADAPEHLASKQPEKSFEEYKLLLDEVGVHNLESDKVYRHMAGDGTITVIPAKIVSMYIHLIYYGELPSEPEPKQASKQSTELSIDDL